MIPTKNFVILIQILAWFSYKMNITFIFINQAVNNVRKYKQMLQNTQKIITIYILLIQKNIIYKNMIGKILIQKTISKLEQVKTEKQLIFTVVNLKKNI